MADKRCTCGGTMQFDAVKDGHVCLQCGSKYGGYLPKELCPACQPCPICGAENDGFLDIDSLLMREMIEVMRKYLSGDTETVSYRHRFEDFVARYDAGER